VKTAPFNRFELLLTLPDAHAVSMSGRDASQAVDAVMRYKYVRDQLDALDPAALAAELREYGAWDDEELADHEANLSRIVWIAGGNIREEQESDSRFLGVDN
jgi:hypothetical protein